MPLIAFSCPFCKTIMKKYVRTAKDAQSSFLCDKCGNSLKKLLSAGSQSSKIVVDNGLQARAVEINPDIVEINEERSNKNLRED